MEDYRWYTDWHNNDIVIIETMLGAHRNFIEEYDKYPDKKETWNIPDEDVLGHLSAFAMGYLVLLTDGGIALQDASPFSFYRKINSGE